MLIGNPSEIESKIKYTAQLIKQARYIVVFTGAGISTPSGIPDFRSAKNGLWKRYDPMQVASLTSFLHTPELFYDWFRPLFLTSWQAEPNHAHLALATLEQKKFVQFIITQNIDGLHQKSGSTNVIELHGSALRFFCPCCHKSVDANIVFTIFQKDIEIPLCENCGKPLKPDVVLFEEPLPMDSWKKAEEEASRADLMIVIGSSLEVYPACTIPQSAVQRGCRLIINNLSSTPLDSLATVQLKMDTAELLPALLKAVEQIELH